MNESSGPAALPEANCLIDHFSSCRSLVLKEVLEAITAWLLEFAHARHKVVVESSGCSLQAARGPLRAW
eukprot:5451032-Amphidinium_carterae.1